jgi:diguanylate cyclase with GGDEF domain
MRAPSLAALIVGVLLIPTALGMAKFDHDRDVSELKRKLVAETDEHGGALESYFARARSIVLLTANSPAFANVLAEPGSRVEKVTRHSRSIREVTHQLDYLERLYPTSIGEACFIDANGEEYARAVRGVIAKPEDLSTVEEQTAFFAPTFALKFGQVHQTRPYVSPDTKEWVVANATLIPQADGHKRAFVHFEVTVESFRRAMGASKASKQGNESEIRVVDRRTGKVVIFSGHAQRVGAALGVPRDGRFADLARGARTSGVTEVAGHRAAYRRIGSAVGNANDWVIVASAKAPTGSFISGLGPAPIAMLLLALVIIAIAGVSLRARRRELETQATTDVLTGLGNRRKLFSDLERQVRAATAEEPVVLTMFDLNGFKNYNDLFGHPAATRCCCASAPRSPMRSQRWAAAPTGREATSSASSPAPRASKQSSRPPPARSPNTVRASRSRRRSDPSSSRRTRATRPRPCARPTRRCTRRSTPDARPPDARAATC